MTRREAILTTVAVSLLSFESLVLAVLIFFPYAPDPGLTLLHLNIYLVLAPLSTVLLLGALYFSPVRLGIRWAARRLECFKSFVNFLADPFRKKISTIRDKPLLDWADDLKILSRPRLSLVISMAASSLLALIPYRPDLNPTGALAGVDAQVYAGWISQMTSKPPAQALQYSFVEGLDGSRPLLLVILYAAALGGASPSLIIELLPVVLAPLLSLSVYFFVSLGQGSARLAGLAALFTPLSFYITVGMWGSYYANWLGLILTYPLLASLLRFSKSPSRQGYGLALGLSVALFLTHPWTWLLLMATCLVFVVSLWRETNKPEHVKMMIGLVGAGIVLDIAKSLVFSTRSVAGDLLTKAPGVVGSLIGFWSSLVEALFYTHGGLLGSWILIGLALLGSIAIRFKDWFERLLILWLGVGSVPFLLLDGYHKARIVYDLPIPVLASIGTLLFVQLVGTRNVRWHSLWILTVLVSCAAYAVQGVLLV